MNDYSSSKEEEMTEDKMNIQVDEMVLCQYEQYGLLVSYNFYF